MTTEATTAGTSMTAMDQKQINPTGTDDWASQMGTRTQRPFPGIQNSLKLLRASGDSDEGDLFPPPHQYQTSPFPQNSKHHLGGGGGKSGDGSHVVVVTAEVQGRTPRGNVLQQVSKGSDKDNDHDNELSTTRKDSGKNDKKIMPLSSEATTSGNLVSNKKVGSGYNDKVGSLHLLVVDDSGLSRRMLARVSRIGYSLTR